MQNWAGQKENNARDKYANFTRQVRCEIKGKTMEEKIYVNHLPKEYKQ